MTDTSSGSGSHAGSRPVGFGSAGAIALRARRLPCSFRFLLVGVIGLACNVLFFSLIASQYPDPLIADLLALVAATFVTWRLNRAFTFARTGRPQSDEAVRYAAVTVLAQGTSYAVFAALALTALAGLPQAAILVGAAAGALISYNGHRLFAFAPVGSCAGALRP